MSLKATSEEDIAKKQEAEMYIRIAASAAGSGDFSKAKEILRIAENLYSTPLGKKIIKDAQKAKVKKASKTSDSDDSASESDEPSDESSEEEMSSEEDSDDGGSAKPVNLKSFQEASILLDYAEQYFVKNEMELKAKSASSKNLSNVIPSKVSLSSNSKLKKQSKQ